MNLRFFPLPAVLLVLLFCNSCSSPVSINQANRDITEIQKDVINGDTSAYQELFIVSLDYPRESFLFYALIMANKHDHPQAYFDVYNCLVGSYLRGDETFEDIDPRTQKLALEYLHIAATKGVKEAQATINELQASSTNN